MTDRKVTVLVEHPSPLVVMDLREELEAAGFEVLDCLGPRRRASCPLLEGEDCDLVERADVVVNALAKHRLEVYLTQRRRFPHTPVLVDLSDQRQRSLAEVVDDVRQSGPVPGGALVERLREAVTDRDASDER